TTIQSEISNVSEILADLDIHEDKRRDEKLSKNMYGFLKDHPLGDTHALRLIPENDNIVADFIGATLPRRDQGDREFYCSTMLALFHPWRTGKDLKKDSETWDDAFAVYPFTNFQKELMNNFNIHYECLDARDDYRAQMKKGTASHFASSWDDPENSTDNYDVVDPNEKGNDEADFDDIPVNLQNIGKTQQNRLTQMQMMNNVLRKIGWM
ncbi:hypothetical protein M413DRAFT_53333, partial [Hebeloma cylindrosporum]